MERNVAMGASGHWVPPWLAGTRLPTLGLGAFEHRLSDSLASSSSGIPPLALSEAALGRFLEGFSSLDVRGSSARQSSLRLLSIVLSCSWCSSEGWRHLVPVFSLHEMSIASGRGSDDYCNLGSI